MLRLFHITSATAVRLSYENYFGKKSLGWAAARPPYELRKSHDTFIHFCCIVRFWGRKTVTRQSHDDPTIFHVDIPGGPINLVCQAKRKGRCPFVAKYHHDFDI